MLRLVERLLYALAVVAGATWLLVVIATVRHMIPADVPLVVGVWAFAVVVAMLLIIMPSIKAQYSRPGGPPAIFMETGRGRSGDRAVGEQAKEPAKRTTAAGDDDTVKTADAVAASERLSHNQSGAKSGLGSSS